MGVVAAIIPSTNPTSTVLYKSIISLISGNGIVISPHPGAKKCILAAFEVVREAAEAAGYPLQLRLHDGYDHSYYFISTFIGEHLAHHANAFR